MALGSRFDTDMGMGVYQAVSAKVFLNGIMIMMLLRQHVSGFLLQSPTVLNNGMCMNVVP